MFRTASADSPGVTFPPPFIFGGFILIGFGLDRLWPVGFGPGLWQLPAGVIVIALGLLLAMAGARKLRRAGTSIHPNHPTSALVTDGPWRFSRNPLYVSLALVHVGIGIAANTVWVVVLVVPALVIVRYAVIAREERYLEAKFGETYRHYKASVRRWL